MRIGKKKRRASEIDITPLMDVIFLLLIFFMVASSFHEETRALEVTLPRAEHPKIITVDEAVLNITVTKENRIFLNDDEVEPTELIEKLKQLAIDTARRDLGLHDPHSHTAWQSARQLGFGYDSRDLTGRPVIHMGHRYHRHQRRTPILVRCHAAHPDEVRMDRRLR